MLSSRCNGWHGDIKAMLIELGLTNLSLAVLDTLGQLPFDKVMQCLRMVRDTKCAIGDIDAFILDNGRKLLAKYLDEIQYTKALP
jgi:hypothetical protein